MELLEAIATGRDRSYFADDFAAATERLSDAFSGRRVLLIGGAGSIGSATLRSLLPLRPAHVTIVDHNENGLATLIRSLRAGGRVAPGTSITLLPLDFGGPAMHRLIRAEAPFDAVLNFAALKHVRTEKHPAAVMQMLDTNVMAQLRLVRMLRESGVPRRYFTVSTDKAARPANFMGASKRLMEIALADELGASTTSVTFGTLRKRRVLGRQSLGKLARSHRPKAPRSACPPIRNDIS